MKITREQYNKWNAEARKYGNFQFDVERYVIWGEKQLVKDVPVANGEYIRFVIGYYEKRENWRTIGYVPMLNVDRLVPTDSGCYRVHRVDAKELGELVTKKNYNALCKLVGAVEDIEDNYVA